MKTLGGKQVLKRRAKGRKRLFCINYEMGRLSRPILLYEAGANRFGTRTNAQKNTYTQAHRVKAHEDFKDP